MKLLALRSIFWMGVHLRYSDIMRNGGSLYQSEERLRYDTEIHKMINEVAFCLPEVQDQFVLRDSPKNLPDPTD